MPGKISMSEHVERPRAISAALVAFALIAVPIGLMDPHGRPQRTNAALTLEQRQIDDADAVAGFPVPQHSDESPRGPEP